MRTESDEIRKLPDDSQFAQAYNIITTICFKMKQKIYGFIQNILGTNFLHGN
jgi:hypothetical protein